MCAKCFWLHNLKAKFALEQTALAMSRAPKTQDSSRSPQRDNGEPQLPEKIRFGSGLQAVQKMSPAPSSAGVPRTVSPAVCVPETSFFTTTITDIMDVISPKSKKEYSFFPESGTSHLGPVRKLVAPTSRSAVLWVSRPTGGVWRRGRRQIRSLWQAFFGICPQVCPLIVI